MKSNKKALLTLTILAAMSLMAAEDYTIQVTTFDDEDGTNPSKCSLREAITAASTHKAYGGCPQGQKDRNLTNTIQLDVGEYTLNSELAPTSNLIILGKTPYDYSRPNVITNEFPAQTEIKTRINARGLNRILNTTSINSPSLTLKNLELLNGFSPNKGGALLLGGQTDLTNVSIVNSNAQSGGAIFINHPTSGLAMNQGWIRKNNAAQGSVLAMTCLENLNYAARTIEIAQVSFTENGTNTSQSAFSLCGAPNFSLKSSTITANKANTTTGNIFQWTNRTDAGQTVDLSDTASINLTSNTIVKNEAKSILSYGLVGGKKLSHNIFAFNTGRACSFNQSNIDQYETIGNFTLVMNAMNFTGGANSCELPSKMLTKTKSESFDITGLRMTDLFSSEQPLNNESTLYVPMYFPKENATNGLMNRGSTDCHNLDQRSVLRLKKTNIDSANASNNTCDIGATEIRKLEVNNYVKSNSSMLTLVKGYEDTLKLFQDDLKNPQTKSEHLPYYRSRVDEYQKKVDETKKINQYRPILFDPFIDNIPDEAISKDGKFIETKHFNNENYEVSTVVKGVGKIDTSNNFIGAFDPRLKCEWNSQLKQIVLYRTDGRITASGDNEICEYTLSTRSTPKKTAKGFLSGNIINIAPNVPKSIEAVINPRTNNLATLNLLSKADDDGDGKRSSITTQPNKPAFAQNAQGQELAIRFIKIPDPVSVKAEREGPCIDDRFKICHGGNVEIRFNNSLEVFSYNIEYEVLDADGMASNKGVIEVKNTETAVGSVRNNGGGSLGLFGLFGLIGLILMRSKHIRA